MKKFSKYFVIFVIVALAVGVFYVRPTTADAEFPQQNAWYQATPSVVWCGDPESTTTLEVHIVGRSDVARLWLTDMGTTEDEGRAELFDDGTHGDEAAGDKVFTLGDVVFPCETDRFMVPGWKSKWMMLRVELNDGQYLQNNYGFTIGYVDPKYKGAFEVAELAPGITATAYSVFIEDSAYEVMNDYPVAEIYCGKGNNQAYQKLYTVFPDVFDFASVMPGMQIYKPDGFGENTPYNVLVSNDVQNIGMDLLDNTADFGSAGKLKAAIYQSFSSIAIFEHEIAHAWGAAIGQDLGLLSARYNYDVNQGHWNEYADMEGQLGSYYFDSSGAVGHFSHKGENTWSLIPNYETEPYSPLELYVMGLIPPEEVPPIHILTNPDTSDTDAIKASSVKTVTIEEIIASEGGERIPSHLDSQKDFTMAFIVTQDLPYNDAAYAYFSLMSYQLTSKEGVPEYNRSYGPFYWASGGRATVETLLPLDLVVTLLPDRPNGLMEVEEQPAEELAQEEEEQEAAPPEEAEPAAEEQTDSGGEAVEEVKPERQPICGLLPAGIVILPLLLFRRRKRK